MHNHIPPNQQILAAASSVALMAYLFSHIKLPVEIMKSALRCSLWLLVYASLVALSRSPALGQFAQAPVEVRVPMSPQAVPGSDGLTHLAYELHVTNFYQSTGTLQLRRVAVLPDSNRVVMASFTGAQVNQLLAHPAADSIKDGLAIEAGKRIVLFLWLTLPAGMPPPHTLRHQLEFVAPDGVRQLVDGVRISVSATPPVVIGAPLRAGPWLAYEGPGNHFSHHWGSLVAVNGQVTIPQRYAIDFFGLDAAGHAVRTARDHLATSTNADWLGFGAEVLAVADGVVRDARDGEPNHPPFAPLPPPTDLTTRTLMGNFVVLEIAPGVFAQYAHLQPGSLRVRVGERVRRGTVLGRLGQSGNANAPHLHFQVATAATFEESEGLPFVLEQFDQLGVRSLTETLDRTTKPALRARVASQRQLPLDGLVLRFP